MLRRVPTNLDPPPEKVLSAAELARAERWKRVYQVGAHFGIDCWRDAEDLTNQFDFLKWLAEHGLEARR